MAASRFSTALKWGTPNPTVFNREPYYDLNLLYDKWSGVFGADRMCPRLFYPSEFIGGDLLKDISNVVGLNMAGKVFPPKRNQSLNQGGADFLLALNRHMPNVVENKWNMERQAIVDLVSTLCPGKFHPATRSEAIAFYRQFSDGNERLKAKAFPTRTKPLFDEDFSDYPETIDHTPNYDDAVRLAIQIWKKMAIRNQMRLGHAL
jgi:hypothetical protein